MSARAVPIAAVSSDTQVGVGWAGRVMHALAAGWTLVLVNLLFFAGALAGLLVAGIVPSAAAAVAVLLRDAESIEREGGVVRLFVREYRRMFRRAVLAGLPLLAAAVLVIMDAIALPHLGGPAAAALSALTIVVGVVAVFVGLAVVTLLVRYDDGPVALLRYAVTVALASPSTVIAVVIAVVAVVAICLVFPVVVPLIGASLILAIAARLIDRRLMKLDPQHPSELAA